MYKLNTLEFNKIYRFHYARGTDFKQDFVENLVNICYIPTRGNCFIKCNNFFTHKDYTKEFLTIIRTEQRRSKVVTSARIQPFCRKNNINICVYDGFRINPRKNTEKNTASKILNNHFCLIWKSNGVSFDEAKKELKNNFKVIDNVISGKNVESYIKYKHKPKIVQS